MTLLLRAVTASDLPLLFAHQLDPVATRMAAVASRDWNAFSAHWKAIFGNPSCLSKTILFDGEVVGNIGAWTTEDGRFVGYWVGRDHWGRGIATRALGEFLRLENTRPLWATVVAHNVASIRVLEKCGFHRTGGSSEDADGIVEWRMQLDAPSPAI